MNTLTRRPDRRKVLIVVDPKDPRRASATHDGKVIFTIRTDVSGVHPSLVVVATETYLKSMAKGKTGITLWNGSAGFAPPNRSQD